MILNAIIGIRYWTSRNSMMPYTITYTLLSRIDGSRLHVNEYQHATLRLFLFSTL